GVVLGDGSSSETIRTAPAGARTRVRVLVSINFAPQMRAGRIVGEERVLIHEGGKLTWAKEIGSPLAGVRIVLSAPPLVRNLDFATKPVDDMRQQMHPAAVPSSNLRAATHQEVAGPHLRAARERPCSHFDQVRVSVAVDIGKKWLGLYIDR